MFDQSQSNRLPNSAGLGYKPQHFAEIMKNAGPVSWFEVHAENYMGQGGRPLAQLRALSERFPISVHGVGLSIGGETPLDTDHLARLRHSYYVFTIVRNPLARLHSCYANKFTGHRERGLPNPFTEWGMHNDMSFAEFVQQVALIPDLQSNTHFRSMHPFLTHRGKLLPHTICKLEHLEKDWQVVRQNIPGFPDLPRINQTNFSDQPAYLSAYNRELAQLAYGRYQQDIELLGYEEEIQHMIATLA